METFSIGSNDRSWTTAGSFRGNVFRVRRPVTLARFEMYLAPQEVCELQFVVYSAPQTSKRYTLEWSTTRKAKPTAQFYSSGDIDLRVEAGRSVVLGVGWSRECEYFSSVYGEYDGSQTSLGVFVASVWDNAYTNKPGFVPRNTGVYNNACYHQVISVVP